MPVTQPPTTQPPVTRPPSARHPATRSPGTRSPATGARRRNLRWLPVALAIWATSFAAVPTVVLVHEAMTDPGTAVENASDTRQQEPDAPAGAPAPQPSVAGPAAIDVTLDDQVTSIAPHAGTTAPVTADLSTPAEPTVAPTAATSTSAAGTGVTPASSSAVASTTAGRSTAARSTASSSPASTSASTTQAEVQPQTEQQSSLVGAPAPRDSCESCPAG